MQEKPDRNEFDTRDLYALEAVLFSMGEAVDLSGLSIAMGMNEKETRALVLRLQSLYEEEKRGLKIVELDGSYQMCSSPLYYDALIRIASHPKKPVLTDVILETLSIIAYKQPVTRAEIEKIRGVSSEHAINRLVEFGLVCELGRLEAPGRPILFGTTEEFLRSFGVSSPDLLPPVSPEKVEEFKSQAEEEMQVRLDI